MNFFLTMVLPIIAAAIFFSLVRRVFKTRRRLSSAITSVFAVFFFLAFALIMGGSGVIFLARGMQSHDWKTVYAAVLFLLIGGLAVMALIWGVPAMLRQGRLKVSHPDAPWLWDSDWTTGMIPDHAAGSAVGSWIAALIWNCFAIFATILAMQQFGHTHDRKLLIIWIFQAVGVGLLIMAVRATMRAAHFHDSVFNLKTLPASPGSTLAGTIHVTQVLRSTGPIRLQLTCIRDDRSAEHSIRNIVWEDEQLLDSLPPAEIGTDIPVYFAIPRDMPASTSASVRREIAWRLEVTASTAEGNYRSRFRIPVFEGSNPIVVPPPDPTINLDRPATQPPRVDLPGITVSLLADGGCALYFAAARNRGAISFLTATGVIVTAVAVLIPRFGAPLPAKMIAWTVAILLDLAAVHAWLAFVTITARPQGLQIDRGLLLLRRQRNILGEAITDIVVSLSSQAGNTYYYALTALVGKATNHLVGGIRGKRNAEYLAEQITRSLGIALAVQTT